jgi:hypothetical protein
LTILVGDAGAPTAPLAQAPVAPPTATLPADLNGWDELGFDFLPEASSRAA